MIPANGTLHLTLVQALHFRVTILFLYTSTHHRKFFSYQNVITASRGFLKKVSKPFPTIRCISAKCVIVSNCLI